MTNNKQQANTHGAEVAAAASWFKATDGCVYNNPPTPDKCPTCAGWVLAREVEKLRDANIRLASSLKSLRDAASGTLESLTSTEYCLGVIKPALEKITGPDWRVIFESLRDDVERLQNALAETRNDR